MTLLSIQATAEILDDTPRHVRELITAGELEAVDIANHRTRPGKTRGADGKTYPTHKQRLRVTAESLRLFILRRTIGARASTRRRKPAAEVIQFFK